MRLTITCLFLFRFLTVAGQDDQFLKQHWFKNEPVCSQQYQPQEFFSRQFPNPDDIWKMHSILRVSAVGVCRKTEKLEVTREVHLGLAYVDLEYRKGDSLVNIFTSVYASLKDEKKDWHSDFNMWCKAGKVFCLSKDKSLIRVVSLNTCAYMRDFEKLMTYYRRLEVYDAVIFVRCGSSAADVELAMRGK